MFKNRFIMVSKKNLWRNVGNIKNIFVPLQRILIKIHQIITTNEYIHWKHRRQTG